MKRPKILISIHIEAGQLAKIDRLLKQSVFDSRAELIRQVLKEGLDATARKWEEK